MSKKPRYPIYVISKGRWYNPLTANALEKINVPFYFVIEPQEYKEYAKVVDPKKILLLPFKNLGQGSIPARNWVWDHALQVGHFKRHWILDDNIRKFYRLNANTKFEVLTGAIFRAAEDFTDRYTNVGLSGFNYEFFCLRRAVYPPYYLNTRVYSCILIDNALPFRWRGKYNEDTDLSLQVLKSGGCTILFNAFLAKKLPTMTMKGGNTDELYKGDGRKKMAEALVELHPDVARVTQKYNRVQHHVDYRQFSQNLLVRKEGLVIPQGIDNYGMVLKKVGK